MKLNHGLHLAYCTNVHRGENWAQTMASLNEHTLAVKAVVSPGKPYAIGLRLSEQAARELSDQAALTAFRHWLDRHDCYVFTINGFPYGKFHGARVKEQVYLPDWTSRARLDYTQRLFDLLAEILPAGMEGSVSTLPGSFKEFGLNPEAVRLMQSNLWECVDHIEKVSSRRGQIFHLGLEPEPLGFFETTAETCAFFGEMRDLRPSESDRLIRHLGVNYDTCHLAIEFEEPAEAVNRLRRAGLRLSKLHLSSALALCPTVAARQWLQQFGDDTYLHQVVEKVSGRALTRYRDLNVALAAAVAHPPPPEAEWRVHFHIPLHSPATEIAGHTADHLRGVLDLLKSDPGMCRHLEMETYTWEVMPAEMKRRNVVDQLAAEYDWSLAELRARALA